jgi:carbohydrate-selective porin OprB
MVNAGVAIDGLFNRADDRLGIGATWSRPMDNGLDDQGALDVYYRFQLSPRVAITPTAQLVIDPVRNSEEDQVLIWGIRSRFAL